MTSRTHALPGRFVASLLIAAQLFTLVPVASAKEKDKAKSAAAAKPAAPPVKVNRTVPKVEPPRALPEFSAAPSDAEIFRAHVFEEPLVAIGVTTAAENRALADAILAYANAAEREDVASFDTFLTKHPSSPWRAALLADLGLVYRRSGHFSKALAAWNEAWTLARPATTVRGRAVADVALSQYATLLARLGRMDELKALLEDVKERPVGGSAATRLDQAKESLDLMQKRPEASYRCGPLALGQLVAIARKSDKMEPKVSAFPSTAQGTSLLQMKKLGQDVGLDVQIAKREAGADMIVPALVHWKEGHFAALVREDKGKYLIQDPTFGDDIWMSKAAIDSESSGHMLVMNQKLPAGWQAMGDEAGDSVWGKGATPITNLKEVGGCEASTGTCGPPAMPVAFMQLMTLNLRIVDTPFGYQPPVGPNPAFTMSYNSKESFQPQIFPYSNLGPKWTFNWLSYIQDDPSNLQADVNVYLPGGGVETSTGFNSQTGAYAPSVRSATIVVRTSSSPIRYERRYSDGSVDVYSVPDGAAASPRKVLLKSLADPAGNAVTLTYDSNFRIVAATDAIGQVTTVSYEHPGDPLVITKVTDPFGREAHFQYNEAGQLSQVTDVIGMASQFSYESGDFINAMTTPYGTSRFRRGQGRVGDEVFHGVSDFQTLTVTDPMGGTEMAMLQAFGGGAPPSTETAPTGFAAYNHSLITPRTLYWDKRAMALHPGDPTKARQYRWLYALNSYPALVSGVKHSEKAPLEGRIWYSYPGQVNPDVIGTSYQPSRIARVLDDGATQTTFYEYNAIQKVTRTTDPAGRTTLYIWGNDNTPDADAKTGTGMDLLQVKQVNGQGTDLLLSATYNDKHEPLTITNASGQVSSYTYNARGQILTATTPPRAGITENRTTTYGYDANGFLQTVTGPATGATGSYTYDGYGRLQTATDSDSYTVTAAYDALDRLTKVTYPDATFQEATYNRLDVEQQRDRLGRMTKILYDAQRHPVVIQDPKQQITTLIWCGCGALDKLIDPNGNTTSWTRDAQGRVTQKSDGDGSATAYGYEQKTSRIKSVTDAKNQTTAFSYLLDNRLSQVAHTGGAVTTPDVSMTYDPIYGRVATRTDGTGTTQYAYNPINGAIGAGQLATLDGPWANDAITYTYDELGRVMSRAINGISSSVTYDHLSRPSTVTNALDTFNYGYEGITGRLSSVTSSSGPNRQFSYLNNSGHRQLERIRNLTNGAGLKLSQFDYAYNGDGQISTWTQQLGADPGAAKAYTLSYDSANRLTNAVLKAAVAPQSVIHNYTYGYDAAGNRTSEQVDAVIATATYNQDNELVGQGGGGSLTVRGTTNEPAGVTLQGSPAPEGAGNSFAGQAAVGSGTSNVVVSAKDYSGNVRTSTYQVTVGGPTASPTYDANGNMTGDGTRTYEWDGEDRLTAINQGTHRSEFSYDGLGRRVGIVEKDNGTTTSNKKYLWVGQSIAEERDSTGATTTKRFFGQGFQQAGNSYFYTRDHLGSVREVVDTTGAVRARYDYDPYGRRTKISGDIDADFGYTGHFEHAQSGLKLALYRAYDANLGRWLSRDPIGLAGGLNLYAYVGGDPINAFDPLGLFDVWNNWAMDVLTDSSVVDFSAGFGDNMSFGLTSLVRSGMGTNDVVNTCSGAYDFGQFSATAISVLATGGSALLKSMAARATRTVVRTAAQPFVNAVRGSGGFVHHINTLFGHPGVPTRAFFPTGGLPAWIHSGSWNLVRLADRPTHLAAHAAAKSWDKLGHIFFHPLATAARIGHNLCR